MSEFSGDISSPVVRFSWGGAIATFFTDDGIHVFGKGSSRILLKERLLLTGVPLPPELTGSSPKKFEQPDAFTPG